MKFFVLFILLSPVAAIQAQQPQIEWAKIFGSSQGAGISDIQPTSDGNLIVLAATNAADSNVVCLPKGSSDVWVFKMDMQGNIIWQNCYGGSAQDGGYFNGRILCTNDGGYIFMVTTESTDVDVTFNHGFKDIWIVKLDINGSIQWQRCYGGGGTEAAFCFSKSSDGGYLFGAVSNTVGSDGDIPFHYGTFLTVDAWVVKIDSIGNILWNKIFGGINNDYLCSIAINGDSIVLFGFTNSTDGDLAGLDVDEYDGWILVLDFNGSILWTKVYGNDLVQSFTGGIVTSTNHLIGFGDSDDINTEIGYYHGGGDVYLMKANSNGHIV